MARQKERGNRKPHGVYCTAEHVEVVRELLKLSDDQIAYVKAWIDRGAVLKPKS